MKEIRDNMVSKRNGVFSPAGLDPYGLFQKFGIWACLRAYTRFQADPSRVIAPGNVIQYYFAESSENLRKTALFTAKYFIQNTI